MQASKAFSTGIAVRRGRARSNDSPKRERPREGRKGAPSNMSLSSLGPLAGLRPGAFHVLHHTRTRPLASARQHACGPSSLVSCRPSSAPVFGSSLLSSHLRLLPYGSTPGLRIYSWIGSSLLASLPPVILAPCLPASLTRDRIESPGHLLFSCSMQASVGSSLLPPAIMYLPSPGLLLSAPPGLIPVISDHLVSSCLIMTCLPRRSCPSSDCVPSPADRATVPRTVVEALGNPRSALLALPSKHSLVPSHLITRRHYERHYASRANRGLVEGPLRPLQRRPALLAPCLMYTRNRRKRRKG